MSGAWRLLVTEPLDGATNMAIDEALLRARIAGDAPPTVRFYGWTPPTVSLGYAQPLDDGIDRERCRRWGIGLVRRPTGGSAILHEPPEREVTYSVVARAGDFAGGDDVLATYRRLGRGLAAGFARLGLATELVPLIRGRREGATPAFCFIRTGAYEIAVAGRKLVGSAQRRQSGAFLQHGSILLDADPARVRAVFPGGPGGPGGSGGPGGADPLDSLTTLAAALGRPVAFDAVVPALAEGLRVELDIALRPDGLSAGELALAERLVAEKYTSETWLAEGRVVAPAGARAAAPALPR